MSLAWSRDGETLGAGLHDGHLAFLDSLGEGSVAPTRQMTGGFVMDLATSESGDYLASLGGDGDVMLWDTATWRPYGQPLTDDAGLGWTYFPPDEHVVRTYDESGLVTEIDVRPSAWVAAACRAAHRDLTVDESAQLRPGELTRPTCPA